MGSSPPETVTLHGAKLIRSSELTRGQPDRATIQTSRVRVSGPISFRADLLGSASVWEVPLLSAEMGKWKIAGLSFKRRPNADMVGSTLMSSAAHIDCSKRSSKGSAESNQSIASITLPYYLVPRVSW